MATQKPGRTLFGVRPGLGAGGSIAGR